MSAFPHFGERPLENRGRVVRMALIYTPLSLISLALVCLAIFEIASGNGGFVFMLVFFGLILLLTGFQTLEYLKDLSAQPMEYQGELVKKWHKGNLLIFFLPSFYLAIDSRILSGRISSIEANGATVAMEDGGEGFVPSKELFAEGDNGNLDSLTPGKPVKFKVMGIDGRGRYKLSCRRAGDNQVVTKLFSVTRTEYAMLLEQDIIKVTCYPHSLTVERIERYDDHEKRFVPATDGATV